MIFPSFLYIQPFYICSLLRLFNPHLTFAGRSRFKSFLINNAAFYLLSTLKPNNIVMSHYVTSPARISINGLKQ